MKKSKNKQSFGAPSYFDVESTHFQSGKSNVDRDTMQRHSNTLHISNTSKNNSKIFNELESEGKENLQRSNSKSQYVKKPKQG